ncbi:MAG: hypothetical protein ETSY2_17380, partial [Candidatus Entotheonella gemina]
RWAPSGDNEQPWRFEIIDHDHVVIHAHDTRDWCVYDLDGSASQRALGMLLETIDIAASGEGLKAVFKRREEHGERAPLVDVTLSQDSESRVSELLPYIKARVTQRRPLSTTPLTTAQKQGLEQSVGKGYRVLWLEGPQQRRAVTRLLFRNAHLRLTMEEAYHVHKQTIEWGVQFSEERIPEPAVGADPATMKIMCWALQSWQRVKMLNRFFAGTWLPRLQMDVLPGFRCAAHFVIYATQPSKHIDQWIAGGRAAQRFWLTATQLGLQFQPEMTPIIFSAYDRDGRQFSTDPRKLRAASVLRTQLDVLIGDDINASAIFMGRLGTGPTPMARSIRKPLQKLRTKGPDSAHAHPTQELT